MNARDCSISRDAPRAAIDCTTSASSSAFVSSGSCNCGLTISDIKEILFLRDADRPVASKRLMEILRSRLNFLEERIASLETCRGRLTEVMRDAARARSAGYDVLSDLGEVIYPPPFRFGRGTKD